MKALLLPLAALCAAASFTAARPAPPSTPRHLEGWNVAVDPRLLQGDDAALGQRALRLLQARLVAITEVVPPPALAKLQSFTIALDLNCEDLRSMQYHPGADWLRDNGHRESLAKCVHIPSATHFLSPFDNRRMPWAVLHELAHAYHDQVLGFEEPRLLDAWIKFRDSGKYRSVLTSTGQQREHYALTNQKEFFAEMTEAYFGSNDFFPFVAGELQQAEPELFALMADIWGPLPQ